MGKDDCAILRQGICEGSEFVVLTLNSWRILHSWYGGGPTLRRRAVRFLSGSVEIELYGMQLQVHTSINLATAHAIVESRTATIGALRSRLCDELSLDPRKVRIWDYFNLRKYEEIGKSEDKTIEACRLFDGNPILVECQCADGSWPGLEACHISAKRPRPPVQS